MNPGVTPEYLNLMCFIREKLGGANGAPLSDLVEGLTDNGVYELRQGKGGKSELIHKIAYLQRRGYVNKVRLTADASFTFTRAGYGIVKKSGQKAAKMSALRDLLCEPVQQKGAAPNKEALPGKPLSAFENLRRLDELNQVIVMELEKIYGSLSDLLAKIEEKDNV